MDKGIDKQVQLFLRDYRNGEAIVQRYLKILASPNYITGERLGRKRGEGLEQKVRRRSQPQASLINN